jgi:AraC-like DNA-binding protein
MSSKPVFRDDILQQGWPIVAVRHVHEHAVKVEPHLVTHSYAALSFYVGGRARVEQGSDWKLAPGDVLLVPAGQPHRILEARQPEFWGLGFCVPCFAVSGETALLEPFERVRDGSAAVIHVPAARHPFLETLFREMESLGGRAPGGSAALSIVQRSLLTLILNEVVNAAEPLYSPSGATTSSVVTESLRFIERNALRRLTLGEIARAVGRSSAYVTSSLSQATGRSAIEWIVSARMAEARRLLLHSDEMVDVIAERVGYADPTHFIRMFRRSHGATPAAWRMSRTRHSRIDR